MAESVHDSLDGMYDELQGMDAVWTPPKRKRDQDPESAKKCPNPKSKAAAAKAKGKAKAKDKVVKRTIVKKCRGCAKKMQPGEQAANWPGCVPCKRALDNICKQAFRQGEKAQKYVAEARADDSKLQAMLASYKDLCPETTEEGCSQVGRKCGTWSLVKYVETVTAASGLIKDIVGEMMFEKLFMEFAQTTRGGRMREEEAAAKWLEYMDEIKKGNPDVLYDHGGPSGKIRVWVKTGDILTWRSSYMKEKNVEMEGDSVRKGTFDDVDRLRGELTRNHAKDMGFGEVAAALCRNENAFAGNDGFILNVLDLQQDVECDEDDADNEAQSSKKPEEAKEEVWVERDRVVSSSVRFFTAQMKTFEDKALEQLKKQRQAKAELLTELPDSAKVDFTGEMKILEVRLEAIELCFEEKNADKIKQFIARFSTPSDADASMASSPLQLGQCPPCESYAKLRPVSDAVEVIQKFHTATLPKHIKAHRVGVN